MNTGLFAPLVTGSPRRIQRACACGTKASRSDECESCQRRRLQRHATGMAAAVGAAGVDAVLASPGVALDSATRSLMEGRFGHDFSRVRVHAGAAAAASARALNAHAYASGDHLVFGAGRYAPQSRSGRWLLAHELAHAVQQHLGGPATQASRDAASADDPSEAAADRAADAVLAGSPLPTLSATSAGLHCYRITSVDAVGEDERLVHLDTGMRYRVHRSREFEIRERLRGWATARPGADRERVWLEVQWCAGQNHGSVRFSADVPDQVARAVVAAVTSGADPRSILRDARITPRVQVQMLQSGAFRLSATGDVTLDLRGNPTGWSGGLRGSAGEFDFDLRLGPGSTADDRPSGVQGTGTLTWRPGRRTEREDCRRQQRSVVEVSSFSCETERDVPAREVPEQVPVTDRESRYLYFDYAHDSIDRGRSASELQTLARNLGDGFQVSNIAGFTSPEGPRPMTAGRRFIGNTALAQARAVAAAQQVQALCPQPAAPAAGTAAASGAAPTVGACFLGGAGAAGSPEPELYTRVTLDDSGQVVEVEGTPLANAAVGDFLGAADEERHRTPELTERIGRQPSATGRARLVYPLLRRAVITLVRNRVETRMRHEEARIERETAGCPDDVVERAFGGGSSGGSSGGSQ